MNKINIKRTDLNKKHNSLSSSDYFAKVICKGLRWIADFCFKKRYGHRAVVLETVAAVPGMVGAMLIHFKSLLGIFPAACGVIWRNEQIYTQKSQCYRTAVSHGISSKISPSSV
jgi:hypothetical protein